MDQNTDGATPKINPPPRDPLPLQSSVPPLIKPGVAPPPITARSSGSAFSLRRVVAVLLSLCLLLFLVDAFVSLLDDCLILFLHVHVLGGLRSLASLFALLAGIGTYGLMGLTPMIPKRLFLPVSLFAPVASLAIIPLLIYFYHRTQWISWMVSLTQVLLGLLVLYWLRIRSKRLPPPLRPMSSQLRHDMDAPTPETAPRNVVPQERGTLRTDSDEIRSVDSNSSARIRLFPMVGEQQLNPRAFSWLNFSGFALINVFVLFPGVLIYLFFCTSLAVGHLSQGFLSLRPQGFSVQVRKYVRNDGKMIQLVPMAHVGDAQFYHNLTQSFPSNSIILMEGVSDENNLLTNKVTYKRMARSLGLAEQHEEFKPLQGEWVRADVDVAEFAQTTIDLLNVVMLIHKQGLSVQTLMPLLSYSPPPAAQQQVWDDLLRKRNRRVLDELQARLPQSDYLIIPWGAAHMPGISREIQSSGFQLAERHDYTVITFGRQKHEPKRQAGTNGAVGKE